MGRNVTNNNSLACPVSLVPSSVAPLRYHGSGFIKAFFSARRVNQHLVKMWFGRWPVSLKSPMLALLQAWAGMQDETYSAGSPKSPKLREAAAVIQTHEHTGDFKGA